MNLKTKWKFIATVVFITPAYPHYSCFSGPFFLPRAPMAHLREVSTLPLSRSDIELLYRHGFRRRSDIESMQPLDLVSETGIGSWIRDLVLLRFDFKSQLLDLEKAVAILQTVNEGQPASATLTASDITSRSRSDRPVITFR